MRKNILLTIALLCLISFISCKDDGSGGFPPVPPNPNDNDTINTQHPMLQGCEHSTEFIEELTLTEVVFDFPGYDYLSDMVFGKYYLSLEGDSPMLIMFGDKKIRPTDNNISRCVFHYKICNFPESFATTIKSGISPTFINIKGKVFYPSWSHIIMNGSTVPPGRIAYDIELTFIDWGK